MAGGAIPFARFMELALYCPQLGYYERKKDTVGRHGDFYTSVSVGPLFGELLAFQFAEWLAELQVPNTQFQIVEAGAHDGKLATDILRWLRGQRRHLYQQLEYLIIEPSEQRRLWQRETLREFEPRICWLPRLPEKSKLYGVLFSNELLDAMPVHRFGWDASKGTWYEWGVAAEDDRLVWKRLDGPLPKSHFKMPVPPELSDVLPDNFAIEISPATENWWRQAAFSLAAGKLLTIDYGLTSEDFFRPERRDGTLRSYCQHRPGGDLLAKVGLQDITAHVNFAALQQVGEVVGLKTDGLFTQSQFLTNIAGRIWKNPASFGNWTSGFNRQFQTLTHPEHLGRAFKVLVQSK